MTFKDANHYAQFLEAHGHKDWRLPISAEPTNLFNNRAEIGGFTTKPDSGYARSYWSCTVPATTRPTPGSLTSRTATASGIVRITFPYRRGWSRGTLIIRPQLIGNALEPQLGLH